MHNSFFSNEQKKYLRTRSEKGRGALSSTPSPACPSLSWALTPRQTHPTYLLFICFSAFVFLDFFYTGFCRVRHLLLIGFSLKQNFLHGKCKQDIMFLSLFVCGSLPITLSPCHFSKQRSC